MTEDPRRKEERHSPAPRCAYCQREACDDPRCRKLRAEQVDARKEDLERRSQVEALARDHERDLRAAHGSAIPERILRARLPANEQPIVPLREERRAVFAENISAALDRAMSDPDRPFPETTETPADQGPLIRASCTACRGSCCSYGGDRAYLYPDHFRRLLRDHPGKSREEILSEYRSHLPPAVYDGSCVYHTDSGCALPRSMRSNLCNTFLCGDLEDLLQAQPQEGAALPVLAVCVREGAAEIVRSALFDGQGNPILPPA